MKTFLISATIFVFVIILIIIFQNIGNSMNIYILLIQITQNDSAAFPIIVISALGFVSGVLSASLAFTLINEGKNEEEPGGANW